MNSNRLGAPVPVAPELRTLMILPKLPLTAGGFPVKAPILPDGMLKSGWLNKL